MEWFKENWLVLLSIAIVVIGVVAVFAVARAFNKNGKQKSATRDLTVGAVCIAA